MTSRQAKLNATTATVKANAIFDVFRRKILLPRLPAQQSEAYEAILVGP
jgi:hypothetical protein